MWKEDDRLMELVVALESPALTLPTKCPICGTEHAHIFMHRYKSDEARGTIWVWCSSCQGYIHLGYKLPNWWENLDEVNEDELNAFPDYPEGIKDRIDAWLPKLIAAQHQER